nr:alpha/beta fold hydrolase [Clostridia bacterium]
MKKLLSIILCAALLFALAVPSFAEDEAAGGASPVVIVPGFGETRLYRVNDDGSRTLYYHGVVDSFKEKLGDFIPAALASVIGIYSPLHSFLDDIGAVVGSLTGMKPDGTSLNPVEIWPCGVENTSYKALKENGGWSAVDTPAQMAPALAEKVGEENVFVFTYDWRYGTRTLAAQLSDYVDGVLAATGASKVSFYGNSYGCQLIAEYLYTHDNSLVDSVMLCSPGWTGTRMVGDLFVESKNDLDINIPAGVQSFARYFRYELDIDFLLKLLPKRIVRDVVYYAVNTILKDYYLGATSVWCLCSHEDYEELKGRLLDPVENAAVIEEADYVQNGVVTHIPEIIEAAQAAGVRFAVIAGEGVGMMTGHDENGDCIVNISNATGGEATMLGKTFTDGRSGEYIAPSNDLDLTNAFLPDNTWVFQGFTHGQCMWDVSADLVIGFLSGSIDDVYSDPAFPRFADSRSPALTVSLTLEDRADNYLDTAAGEVKAVIRNNSGENAVKITRVRVNGLDYKVSGAAGKLEPGESRVV